MNTLLRDIRLSFRSLVKNGRFTIIVVVTLAIGIGASGAIFSLIRAVLLNPLPFRNSEQLVMIWRSNPLFGLTHADVSLSEYLDWREQSHNFEDMGAFQPLSLNMTGYGDPARLRGCAVTASFFSTLEIIPVIGRLFMPGDNQGGGGKVILLSYSLWQRDFAAARDVLGKTIRLDDEAYEVIGVTPPHLKLPKREIDVWLPVAFSEANMNRGLQSFKVVGRVLPSVTLTQAQVEMDSISRILSEQYPETSSGVKISLVLLREEFVGKIRSVLLTLFAAVGILLLIACANAINLLLFRTVSREREFAIRSALGATSWNIFQQLLVEGLLIGLLSGGAGLLLASLVIQLVRVTTIAPVPRIDEVGIDGWDIVFTLAASLSAGALCAVLSAVHACRPNTNHLLKAQGTAATSRQSTHVRNFVLVSEIALSLVLLISATLLVRSFWILWHSGSGLRAEGLLTAQLSLSPLMYSDTAQQALFSRRVLDEVSVQNGVLSVSVASSLPILGVEEYRYAIEDLSRDGSEMIAVSSQTVSPDYFRTMGIPLLVGRPFDYSDIGPQPKVALVNETMARRYWPGQSAIGKRIKLGSIEADAEWISIVGVAGDVKQSGLDAPPAPEIYLPYFQQPSPFLFLIVRAGADPSRLASSVQSAVWSVDKNQPLTNMKSMETILAESTAERRLIMIIISAFAFLSFVLTGIGIYGLISYSITQRTHDIAVRMALGAQPRAVLALVLRQGGLLILIGTGLGSITALILTRFMSAFLFEVSTKDPSTFLIAALLLIAVGLLATYLPARRATRIDPVTAVRYE
ncbi:MAG: ABC transporter permease [Blastocatellia bacterium]